MASEPGDGVVGAASFDAAAKEAEASFPAAGTAQDVVVWWMKWYLTAGHKRLGRIVVARGRALVKEAAAKIEADSAEQASAAASASGSAG